MVISNGFKNVSLSRKMEIIEMAKYIHDVVNSYFFNNGAYVPNWEHKLYKSYVFFKKYYKCELTEDEKSVFYLYIIFPNDEFFLELVTRYNQDFERVSSMFNVAAGIARLRYSLYRDIVLDKEIEEVLTKKKAMN